MRIALVALLIASGCRKEPPRTVIGPVSIVVPEGFVEDASRARALEGPLESKNRVWVHKETKMQVGLSFAKLPHQAQWDGVAARDLLSEMVNQELTAGERAGLKTVSSERKFEGDALHYLVEGDMQGKLATKGHTALWLDAKGDCWHASAVCTAAPADVGKCSDIIATARFDAASAAPHPDPLPPQGRGGTQ